jgi:conjugal transfer mating pair stabilization protein TraN
MSKVIPLIFVFLISITDVFAQATCNQTSEICVESGSTRIISGVALSKPCWKYQIKYRCYESEVDYCSVIKGTAGCEQVNSVCVSTDEFDQKCNQYQSTYKCGNLLDTTASQVVLLNSDYTVTKDQQNHQQCDSLYPPSNCEKTSSTCVEGAETRKINGYDVYKTCWKYEENYSCKNSSYINNCTNIPSYCKFSSSQCLIDVNNVCVHRQNSYLCSQSNTTSTTNLQCGSNTYCINGQCDKAEEDSKNDFAKSISYLSALNEAGKDNSGSADNLKIFSGKTESCEKETAGYNNCCRDDGWGQDYMGAQCKEDDIRLAQLQSKKLCHYVGSYCSKKIPLIGKCSKTKKTYCCFNSKISRVISEQGRAQLGMGWGEAKSPDCRGLTPQEMERLQFDKMDMGEISSDIAGSATVPDSKYLEEKARQSMRGYEKTTD